MPIIMNLPDPGGGEAKYPSNATLARFLFTFKAIADSCAAKSVAYSTYRNTLI